MSSNWIKGVPKIARRIMRDGWTPHERAEVKIDLLAGMYRLTGTTRGEFK